MQEIKRFLAEERKTKNIYPESKNVFRAFDLCPFEETKVVILGQDPYHTPGTADGLAFSTQQAETPKSLAIIFKEIYKDLNIQYIRNVTYEEYFPTNNLEKWAKGGFLLLNTALTVEEGKPGSHKDIGWDTVITQAIKALTEHKKGGQVVFLLWGKEAKAYSSMINAPHFFLESAHPAAEIHKPGEGGFLGCRHFSIVRDIRPMLNQRNAFKELYLDSCFDKEKAKEIIRENYPIDAQKMCDYIDKELIIHIPVNKKAYWEEISKFETLISTKYSDG
jgi:uracil-DNA glycosylase